MQRYHITLGSSTTAGGRVIFAGSHASINGIRIAHNGCERYELLMKASEEKIDRSAGMKMAVAAAVNTLSGGIDKLNGAYFWDGKDIKTNYAGHHKVGRGIKFSDPSHNLATRLYRWC